MIDRQASAIMAHWQGDIAVALFAADAVCNPSPETNLSQAAWFNRKRSTWSAPTRGDGRGGVAPPPPGQPETLLTIFRSKQQGRIFRGISS
ncbi:hypothetical protein CMUS01_10340 [Colletotrichum musicola]|uniref:Uncharacterized protein n=1 Tax=Colletotrichum musicola TaxID=2175873 RepID=A0A8H6N8L0_9PEZI|nr:hypothetical protein CMUS01_10340 [Colletotrichum musicola]